MTLSHKSTLLSLAAIVILVSSTAHADHDRRARNSDNLLLNVVNDVVLHATLDRDRRSRYSREYRSERRNSGRNFGDRRPGRNNYGGASFTSEPVRGGSSRRTRIIENPYPNRPVVGVSFTGIERKAVHINDVITYPRKRLISHTGYSLSLRHPSRFMNTRGYVDYISVKAKRKEYFTVTFHYE